MGKVELELGSADVATSDTTVTETIWDYFFENKADRNYDYTADSRKGEHLGYNSVNSDYLGAIKDSGICKATVAPATVLRQLIDINPI
jgi:hypothetical protein